MRFYLKAYFYEMFNSRAKATISDVIGTMISVACSSGSGSMFSSIASPDAAKVRYACNSVEIWSSSILANMAGELITVSIKKSFMNCAEPTVADIVGEFNMLSAVTPSGEVVSMFGDESENISVPAVNSIG